jgi:methylated-DNA-[protein]-cysteine S-methyltransferase
LIKEAARQLNEYFNGERKVFDLPLDLTGTSFQTKVWQELLKIPYGETKSYKDVAIAINNPKACRAVGMANNKNRIMIVVPCHRIIGSNKKLVGYAGGLKLKEQLLNLEKNFN